MKIYGDSKADWAYNEIKKRILSLEFLPKQPLREIELSELLQVSRTPVRMAIAMLAAEGFVEVEGAKRNLVADVSADAYMQIYQVRQALELLCASLVPRIWRDRSEMEAVRAVVERQAQIMEQPEVNSREFLSADRAFHVLLAEISRNELLRREMSRVYELYWRYNYYSLHANRSRLIVREHMDILEAIEHRDVRRAQELMRAHLSDTKDDILLGLAKGFNPAKELREAMEGYVLR